MRVLRICVIRAQFAYTGSSTEVPMANQSHQSIPLGTVIGGKYRVERHVGDGGMGQVVAGRHLVLNELYAIKFMHHRDLANPQAAARFIREAQAVVRLKNNEHVARVHDVGRHETGDLYIVMELLAGLDLGAVLKTRGILPIHEACSYVLQACNALAEAHDLGIIHRDLKPANLFLTHRKDGSSCIKVLDFGISKVLAGESAEGEVEMTGTREMMGSPLYMSPEQAKSARDVDVRADIWSLGAILYKLLTGKAPIPGQTVAEVSYSLLDEKTPVRPPSELRTDLPRQLEACILRCLDKVIQRRYGRVTDLMVALAPFASRPSVHIEDEDNAATVLRPMGMPASRLEGLGGTLPLGPGAQDKQRVAPVDARREQSGTEVMPVTRAVSSASSANSANSANAQTTQPLDGRALQQIADRRRAMERKESFTGAVILPPVSGHRAVPASAHSEHAALSTQLLPSSPAPQSSTATPMPGAGLRGSGSDQFRAIMPPPIPPAYPTSNYPIAPAARATMPSAAAPSVVPDRTEPPWHRPAQKNGVATDRRTIAWVALLTLSIGACITYLVSQALHVGPMPANPTPSATSSAVAPKASMLPPVVVPSNTIVPTAPPSNSPVAPLGKTVPKATAKPTQPTSKPKTEKKKPPNPYYWMLPKGQ